MAKKSIGQSAIELNPKLVLSRKTFTKDTGGKPANNIAYNICYVSGKTHLLFVCADDLGQTRSKPTRKIFTYDKSTLLFDHNHPELPAECEIIPEHSLILFPRAGETFDFYHIGVKKYIRNSRFSPDFMHMQSTASDKYFVYYDGYDQMLHVYEFGREDWRKIRIIINGDWFLRGSQIYYVNRRNSDSSGQTTSYFLLRRGLGSDCVNDIGSNNESEKILFNCGHITRDIQTFNNIICHSLQHARDVIYFGCQETKCRFYWDMSEDREVVIPDECKNAKLVIYSAYNSEFYYCDDDGFRDTSGKKIIDYPADAAYNIAGIADRYCELSDYEYSPNIFIADFARRIVYKVLFGTFHPGFNAIYRANSGEPIMFYTRMPDFPRNLADFSALPASCKREIAMLMKIYCIIPGNILQSLPREILFHLFAIMSGGNK